MKNRLGTIRITHELLFGVEHSALEVFFSNFYPISINDIGAGVKEYLCMSKHFDEVSDCEAICEYVPTFTRSPSGAVLLDSVTKVK